jgi:hypothetical protein
LRALVGSPNRGKTGTGSSFFFHALTGGRRPILLKNSIAAAPLSVVEKVDPLERSQIDANERGDGLRPPKLTHEKGETSFSTE